MPSNVDTPVACPKVQPSYTPSPHADSNVQRRWIAQQTKGCYACRTDSYIKPFQHLFEKKNFDKLPIRCEWDHEINLTEDAPASIPARLYRMMPVEQEAVDQFVEDELKNPQIQIALC